MDSLIFEICTPRQLYISMAFWQGMWWLAALNLEAPLYQTSTHAKSTWRNKKLGCKHTVNQHERPSVCRTQSLKPPYSRSIYKFSSLKTWGYSNCRARWLVVEKGMVLQRCLWNWAIPPKWQLQWRKKWSHRLWRRQNLMQTMRCSPGRSMHLEAYISSVEAPGRAKKSPMELCHLQTSKNWDLFLSVSHPITRNMGDTGWPPIHSCPNPRYLCWCCYPCLQPWLHLSRGSAGIVDGEGMWRCIIHFDVLCMFDYQEQIFEPSIYIYIYV